MSDIVNIKCPSCKKRTKAERKSKYFHKIGCGMAIVHIIMCNVENGIYNVYHPEIRGEDDIYEGKRYPQYSSAVLVLKK